MLLLQREQGNLLFERLALVEIRAFDDPPDVLQGKFQLAEQQDLLQLFQGRVVIQPVTGRCVLRGMQKADFVIILQGAYAHACQPAHLMDGSHGGSLLACCKPMIKYYAA